MNIKSITKALIIGTVLGILVIRPLSMLPHLADAHTSNVSSFEYIVNSYAQILSFEDFGSTLLSIFGGILLVVLMVMIKTRKRK